MLSPKLSAETTEQIKSSLARREADLRTAEKAEDKARLASDVEDLKETLRMVAG